MGVCDRFRGWEMTFVATIFLAVHWSPISLLFFILRECETRSERILDFFPALTSLLFRRRRRRRTFQNWNSGSKAFNSPHGALALKHRESWSERRRPFYTREQSIAIYCHSNCFLRFNSSRSLSHKLDWGFSSELVKDTLALSNVKGKQEVGQL